MALVNLDIDARDLQGVILDLAATEQQAEKALNSTLVKMAGWLRSKSVKGLSGALAIQQKVLRRRLKSFRLQRRAGGSEITVWYGLDPIALIYLQARQNKGGVKAYGGRFVQSAFIANGSNGNRQVFKRRGKGRLPIDKQRADIEDKANTYIEDDLVGAAEFEARFFKTFEHELQWRTQTR
jgi:hypothetical protein